MLPTEREYWYGRQAHVPPWSDVQSSSVQHGLLQTDAEQMLPAQSVPFVQVPPFAVSPDDDAHAWTTPVGVPLSVTTSH